jgi:L-asparaginase II
MDILAEVWRGPVIESLHRGTVVIADARGKTIASCGDPEFGTFLRSSAKPFQALPLLLSSAAEKFAFDDCEIAIACASHNGEPIHTRIVEEMLRKIDLPSDALLCGIHDPFSRAVTDHLKRQGRAPSLLQNNCSGKHAGMLAVALHQGEPVENYVAPNHPVQQRICDYIAQFSGLPRVAVATDGCTAPTFAMPVRAMATMFARLIEPPDGFCEPCQRITNAMTSHPDLIAGNGEFDTELMRVAGKKIISKIGAEGVWCAAVLPGEHNDRSIGIALKVEDGSVRARPVIALEVLAPIARYH